MPSSVSARRSEAKTRANLNRLLRTPCQRRPRVRTPRPQSANSACHAGTSSLSKYECYLRVLNQKTWTRLRAFAQSSNNRSDVNGQCKSILENIGCTNLRHKTFQQRQQPLKKVPRKQSQEKRLRIPAPLFDPIRTIISNAAANLVAGEIISVSIHNSE